MIPPAMVSPTTAPIAVMRRLPAPMIGASAEEIMVMTEGFWSHHFSFERMVESKDRSHEPRNTSGSNKGMNEVIIAQET